jgi:hypothetical protein
MIHVELSIEPDECDQALLTLGSVEGRRAAAPNGQNAATLNRCPARHRYSDKNGPGVSASGAFSFVV